jgi:hypothetical protein
MKKHAGAKGCETQIEQAKVKGQSQRISSKKMLFEDSAENIFKVCWRNNRGNGWLYTLTSNHGKIII